MISLCNSGYPFNQDPPIHRPPKFWKDCITTHDKQLRNVTLGSNNGLGLFVLQKYFYFLGAEIIRGEQSWPLGFCFKETSAGLKRWLSG